MSVQYPQGAPQRPTDGGGRLALGIVLLVTSLVLLMCGVGILLYAGLGYVMVDESQDDPWVVGSFITGLVTLGLAGTAVCGGVWSLRSRGR